MTVQTSYEDNPAIAFNGMLAEQFSLRQIESGLVEGSTFLLGQAVKPGTADGQYVAALADDAVAGIVIYSGSSENQSDDFKYEEKDQIPVLSKGRYYATANAALAIGDVIAFDPVTGKVGLVVGATTTLAFGKAITSSSADGDLLIIEVDF